jgi:hypothetical protein
MAKILKRVVIHLMVLGGLSLGFVLADPQTGTPRAVQAVPSDVQISAWVVGGGGSLQNSPYQLSGTVGQEEAGPDLMQAGTTLKGGFWNAITPFWWHYVPLTRR